MKYRIRRTTDWKNGYEKPCEDAYEDGKNKFDEPQWAIDICNLKQIDDLVKEVGEIIIGKSHDGENWIEIYDDYRE